VIALLPSLFRKFADSLKIFSPVFIYNPSFDAISVKQHCLTAKFGYDGMAIGANRYQIIRVSTAIVTYSFDMVYFSHKPHVFIASRTKTTLSNNNIVSVAFCQYPAPFLFIHAALLLCRSPFGLNE
jgi:hypothetical protein